MPTDYELHGEETAEAGRYAHVVRHREHFAPPEQALREHTLKAGRQGSL